MVDEQVSVEVPTQPLGIGLTSLSSTNKLLHPIAVSSQDTSGVYQIVRADISSDVPQSFFEGKEGLKAYYDWVVPHIVENGHGVLLKRSSFTTVAGEGVEMKYRVLHQSTKRPVLIYRRFLLLGRVVYTFGFTPPNQLDSIGNSSAKQRERFFNSITVNTAALSHQ